MFHPPRLACPEWGRGENGRKISSHQLRRICHVFLQVKGKRDFADTPRALLSLVENLAH